MANYTDDEINAAVSQIVQTTISNSTGALGERQVNTSFSDTQEAAAGVYILYFNAPYYTLLLGTTRLADSLTTQASTIASLIDAVTSVKRAITPVTDLTTLANAKVALDELSSAVSSRTQGFQDIQAVPAFQRYSANISQFIAVTSPNVVGTSTDPINGATASQPITTVVNTPAGARALIPSLLTQLKTQQDDIIRRVKLMSGAIADLASLNLPQLAAASVISNAAGVLSQHLTDLSALDENSRLTNLRAITLDLLTQQPLVASFGAGLSPSEFITTSGTAKAFSDSLHLATPAAVRSSVSDPYAIVDTAHLLSVAVDGNAAFNYPLPLGFVAEINATLVEPYTLASDSSALSVSITNDIGSTTHVATLGTGTLTADQVVTAVNAALVGTSVSMATAFRPQKLDTYLTMTNLGGTSARFDVLAGGLTGLNILAGDELDVVTGPNAGTTWTITSATATSIYASGSVAIIPVASPGDEVQVGPSARALVLQDTDAATSLAQRRTIGFPVTGGPSDKAAALLGFVAGLTSRSRPVLATEVAANITASTSLFAASAVDVAVVSALGHGSLSDPALVVLAKGQLDGSITAGTIVMFRPTLTIPDWVAVGDKLIIRATSAAGDINAEGVVEAVNGMSNSINVTFTTAISAGDITAEFGAAITFGFGSVFTIGDGPNAGRYTARENQGIGTSCSIEALLDRALPVPKTGSTVSSFGITLGHSFVSFSSVTKSTASSISIANGPVGAAGDLFFSPTELPAAAIGSTSYLQFDTFPAGAAVGDLVQLFENQYNIVSREFSILTVEPGSRVLGLVANSPDVGDFASDFSITFNSNVPNPFGAIRISQTANYVDFKADLDAWLLQPELTTQYYRDLARLMNPVLINSNPTSSGVDSAVNQLKKLSAVLTLAGAAAYGSLHTPAVTGPNSLEFALDEYTSPVEPAVDVLITTLRNKGSDRAVDLLLEGQFSVFFGLDIDTVSYSGALTSASRAVAVNDLPIRKTNRSDAGTQQLIGTIPNEPNYEFDTSDADSPDLPDIPASPNV